jgi:hypothetical protein
MVDMPSDAAYRPVTNHPGPSGPRQNQDPPAATGPTPPRTGGPVDGPPLPPPNVGGAKHPQPPNGGAPKGAPQLPAPEEHYDPSELEILISALLTKMDDAQSKTEQNGLQLDNTQKQEAFKKSTDALKEAVKKITAAKHKQKILGPLMTIAKVFAGIAAVALTLTTGGAAAPLAIALIAYTVVDTTLTVANAISQAKGGPALDLNSVIADGIREAAKGCGANPQLANKIATWGAFAIQAAIAIATIAVSIKGIYTLTKGVANAGGLASKLGTTAFKATKVAAVTGQAVGGLTNVTAGGIAIALAVNSFDADKAKANKEQFDAMAAALTELIKNALAQLEEAATDLATGMKDVSRELSEVGTANQQAAGGTLSMV